DVLEVPDPAAGAVGPPLRELLAERAADLKQQLAELILVVVEGDDRLALVDVVAGLREEVAGLPADGAHDLLEAAAARAAVDDRVAVVALADVERRPMVVVGGAEQPRFAPDLLSLPSGGCFDCGDEVVGWRH